MDKKRRVWLVIFLLITAGWMVFIFYMSARPAVELSGMSEGVSAWVARLLRPDYKSMPVTDWLAYLDVVHTVVRKIAHFTEYALLGVFFAVDVWLWKGRLGKLRHILLIAWLCGTAYAMSDEFHQLFVEGRSGELLDVLIDSSGTLVGVASVCVIIHWIVLKRYRIICG